MKVTAMTWAVAAVLFVNSFLTAVASFHLGIASAILFSAMYALFILWLVTGLQLTFFDLVACALVFLSGISGFWLTLALGVFSGLAASALLSLGIGIGADNILLELPEGIEGIIE